MTNLEHALHSAKDELRSESQMRVNREMTLDRLQEQLRAKVIHISQQKNTIQILLFCFSNKQEDELNRMRLALDESNYHPNTKKSIPDRTKSAPHFGGVHRKVKRIMEVSFR